MCLMGVGGCAGGKVKHPRRRRDGVQKVGAGIELDTRRSSHKEEGEKKAADIVRVKSRGSGKELVTSGIFHQEEHTTSRGRADIKWQGEQGGGGGNLIKRGETRNKCWGRE